jgi:peptide/nickel transport system substrate-binding protein
VTPRPILFALAVACLAAPAAQAERGSDGRLNILYWQAASNLNPYLTTGLKDLEAASLVLEPLARYDPDGALTPWLAEAVPTLENGGVAADLRSVTWRLREGLVWTDGAPVTAADAVFTWRYCAHPEAGCAQLKNFGGVAEVTAVDARTIRVTFDGPKPFPYGPFVGVQSPLLQAAQFADCLGAAAAACTEANFAPVGTGPFVVTDFRPNDVVLLAANPRFRDEGKPAFATVQLKGGGDPASAARAVLETGEFDYAWNANVEPELLEAMLAAGKGEVVAAFGTLVERLQFNQTDPDPALGPARSTTGHPHPILTDPQVVRALGLAIDRAALIEIGYGPAGRLTCNLVPAPPANVSPNQDWCRAQDLAEARRLLDAAGWASGPDGVRLRDGRRLALVLQTTTNSVRQAFQALIKQWWREIGVETELVQVDAGVYFGGDPASPDTFEKFHADVQMFANDFDGTDPETYLAGWTCAQIPGPETQWQGSNTARWCDPDFDALHAELARAADPAARAALAVRLNDMIVDGPAFVALAHRGRVSTKARSLDGVAMNPFDSELWNVADWRRAR